ncbi:MAG: zinc-ribbon domain-containing protein [Gemmataceae bacterium]|nr:zinc-ribbon domain-containing protein [Gemmataceae bacterium]
MPIIIHCPSCSRQLRVPDDLLDREVKCPTCSAIFTASAENEVPLATPLPPPREEEAPRARVPRPSGPPLEEFEELDAPVRRRRPPRRDDDEAYEEEDDEPRPRRRSRQHARDLVAGPAMALMVVGSIALTLSILSLLCNLGGAAGGLAMPRPRGAPGFGGPPNAELVARAAGGVFGVFGAVGGICWGGIVLTGAIQMKNLRSYGYSMAGAIVAMVPCSGGCCLLGLPFGIWALVVLNQPEVREAFS